jgi:hypothetical protein
MPQVPITLNLKHAKAACLKCPGYCCELFKADRPKTGTKKAHWFVKVRIPNEKGFFYSCKKFKNGKCSVYNKRLNMCKSYYCSNAIRGEVPKPNKMWVKHLTKYKDLSDG